MCGSAADETQSPGVCWRSCVSAASRADVQQPDVAWPWPASQVTSSKGWAGMARAFGSPPSMTSASFLIKRIYERYLAPYEQVCGVGGGVGWGMPREGRGCLVSLLVVPVGV